MWKGQKCALGSNWMRRYQATFTSYPQNTYLSSRIIYLAIMIIDPDAQAAPRPQQGFSGAICACCLSSGSRRHTQEAHSGTCTMMTLLARYRRLEKMGEGSGIQPAAHLQGC